MSELTPMQNFENKIKDKLTKDIGDLIPDEALRALIEKATEECFFKDQRIVVGSGFNATTTLKDSVFKEIVKELLAERMDFLVREWIESNKDEMTRQLKDYIEASTEEAMMHCIRTMFFGGFEAMKSDILFKVTDQVNQNINNQY